MALVHFLTVNLWTRTVSSQKEVDVKVEYVKYICWYSPLTRMDAYTFHVILSMMFP